MATTTASPASSSVSTQKVTVRAYYTQVRQTRKDKDGNDVVDVSYKYQVLAETADQKNWKQAEKDGAQMLAQFETIRYSVNDKEGAEFLVADPKQFAYIFNRGLDAVQNGWQAKLGKELEEGTGEGETLPVASHHDETVDMMEYINTAPERKSLTLFEKLDRALAAFPPDVRKQMIDAALAQQAAAQAAAEQEVTQATQEDQPA